MRFADIIGQDELKNHLKNAILMDKTSHAYIISGEKNSGKMMLAEAFAEMLLCENKGEDACGECHSCSQAEGHNHPDIIYVQHEKPNTISVDDIREQIRDSIMIRPYSSEYKIYIIDEAEKMNDQAQNALLKTIEEPPHYAIIFLLTTNAAAFLQTIRSRCITLETKPVKDELIRKYLMEELRIPDYQADVAVSFAQGNVGKAEGLSSSEEFNELRSTVVRIARKLPDGESYEFYKEAQSLKENKGQIDEILDLLQIWYRDVLLYKATGQTDGIIYRDELQYIRKQADSASYRGLYNTVRALDIARGRLSHNVNLELTLQLMMQTIKENYNG